MVFSFQHLRLECAIRAGPTSALPGSWASTRQDKVCGNSLFTRLIWTRVNWGAGDNSKQRGTGERWERQPCWKLTNICQEEICCFQEFQVCEFCPWHICLFKALGLLCVCACERQGQRKLREVKCGGRDNGPWNICECLTWRKPLHVCVWAHAHGHSVWKNKQLK